ARRPRTARGAVAFVAFFAMAASLVSWGLSLVFTGLLVREVAGRLRGIDYRALCSAAYLGLGSVWALGLSSSAALLQATRSAIPPPAPPDQGGDPAGEDDLPVAESSGGGDLDRGLDRGRLVLLPDGSPRPHRRADGRPLRGEDDGAPGSRDSRREAGGQPDPG